MGQMQPIVASL